MDNQYVAQAQAAYQARDFQAASQAYVQLLQDPSVPKGPGDLGYLYHQLGNCLLQLKDFDSAIESYTQATADSAYDAVGAVNCNLGKAYVFKHDYENAVSHFEIATSDAKYDTPYKAYLGMGNALLKLGKNAEAGVAFREAALDSRNPDPSKALLNLGVCFMALNRPADAVASYESALQFDMDAATRNKMYANLGQAYVALGQMQKAMSAFESALADKTYFLSESASVDYAQAAKCMATGTIAMPAIGQQAAPAPAAASNDGNDMSGLDVPADGVPTQDDAYPVEAYADPQYYPAEAYGYEPVDNYNSGDERFFNASDEELERYSKGIARQDRKRRNVGLKILVAFFVLLLLAAGAGVFLYTQGYGYPTQESVVKGLFADTENASSYFVSSMSSDKVDDAMRGVVSDSDVAIDGMDKSMSNSTVYVTASTPEGGEVSYTVSMVRDMLGWKVSGVQMKFASQQS